MLQAQQVLFNFLANAVKFSPVGGAVLFAVTLEPATAEQKLAHVRLSVTDNGLGIAPEDQEKVFEKFTQLDTSVTREHSGTGLGLTICRELSDLLRGRIELDSAVGQGATFTLILPVVFYRPDEQGPPPAGDRSEAAEVPQPLGESQGQSAPSAT